MKNQYITIKVKEGTVLGEKDGHVLIYSKQGDYYYSVSQSDLFRNQDEKIAKMRGEISEHKEGVAETLSTQKEEIENKEKELEDKVNCVIEEVKRQSQKNSEKIDKLIANYKETMSQVFSMIEELQRGGE